MKFSSKKRIAILIVYVDDITLTGDYEDEIIKLRELLNLRSMILAPSDTS